MQRYLFFLILFITGIISISLYSQEKKDTLNKWWKNPEDAWYITVNTGYRLSTTKICREFSYLGEYFNRTNNYKNYNEGNWEWRNINEQGCNYEDTFKLVLFRFDLLLSTIRRIHFGLSYNMFVLTQRNYYSIPFICINGKLEYQHPIFKNEDFYFFGSVAYGYYQSDDFYEGPGNEISMTLSGGVGKVFWKGFFFRFYMADTRLFYQNNSMSRIFYKEQNETIDWDILYAGFELGRRYKLIPDKE